MVTDFAWNTQNNVGGSKICIHGLELSICGEIVGLLCAVVLEYIWDVSGPFKFHQQPMTGKFHFLHIVSVMKYAQ